MKKPSVPTSSKGITKLQTLVCFALVIVICFFGCFGTIFSVEIEGADEFVSKFNDMIAEFGGDIGEIDVPTSVDISFPFLVGSITSVVDLFTAASEASNDFNEETTGNLADKALNSNLVDLIALFVLIIISFGNILVGICNVLLLIMSFTLPITVIIAAIRSIFALIFNRKDIGNAFHKISKAFFSIIGLFPLILLVMLVVPEVKFGFAIYAILACCAVGVIFNLLGSRMKKYEKEDKKYLNLLQIVCGVSLCGYLLFFFNVMNANIFGSVFDAISGSVMGSAMAGGKPDYVMYILAILLIASVFAIVDFLPKILTRLSCMSKSHSDFFIKPAIVNLLFVIIPFVMTSLNENFEIGEEYMTPFIISCVGVVIMSAAEFVLAFVPKSVCPNITAVRRQEIVTGAYTSLEASEETGKASEETDKAE